LPTSGRSPATPASGHLTFAQRTICVKNFKKDRPSFHQKPFPLKIRTIGDLLMVRRKQAGLSYKQLVAETGIRFHWLRRWEFNRCLPSQPEWNVLRKVLKLPPTPILTFTQPAKPSGNPKTIAEHLRKRRQELKLSNAGAAPRMNVSTPSLRMWELGKVFPKHCYHGRITAFLGYNPFPK
jgi:DNA-binding transcriptional regulator YiaG